MRPIARGWKFNSQLGKLEFKKEILDTCSLTPTQRTSRVMADIANSIDPHIQVTVDSPEANGDAWMPVLDLKIWIEWMEDKPTVTYTFYKKPCASEYTILKRSAVSEGVKKSTIFQEALRWIQHVSPNLPWQETARHLSDFSNCLRISGYSPAERFHAIKGALARHEEMLRKLEAGEIKSLNRTREEIQARKQDKGGLTASSWFLKGDTVRVMTCQPTPGW